MDFKKDISINRKGFKIPNGYFESINYDLFKKQKINIDRFSIPTNYFNSIDKQQVYNKIYINKIRSIKSTFYKISSLAAIFIGILFVTNYFQKSKNIHTEDIIEYANQDLLNFSNDDLNDLFASNELNYSSLINNNDLERYFIETKFNAQEYLLQE
jgi:chaperone required for assembly of F1-ATPase